MTASTGTALHAAIMNLKCDTGDRPPLPALAFKLGHRQARHDAAELVSASLGAAQVAGMTGAVNGAELLPCPFCGGTAQWNKNDGVTAIDSDAGAEWIDCPRCGASTNQRYSLMEDCKPLLAEQWNRRASLGAAQVPAPREPDLYDEIECDLLALFARAFDGGFYTSQRIARELVEKMQRARLQAAGAAQVPADAHEKTLKDIRWRLDDIRDMLMAEGHNGRIYGCDEWSTPTVNLATAIRVIDAALSQPSQQGTKS